MIETLWRGLAAVLWSAAGVLGLDYLPSGVPAAWVAAGLLGWGAIWIKLVVEAATAGR